MKRIRHASSLAPTERLREISQLLAIGFRRYRIHCQKQLDQGYAPVPTPKCEPKANGEKVRNAKETTA